MNFFRYDGPFSTAIRFVCRLFILNICFMICSLPIFTIGASATALYSTCLHEDNESNYALRFFRAFRSNFCHATIIWLIILAFSVILLLDFYFLLIFEFTGSQLLKLLSLIIAALFLSMCIFAFPLLAHYENTLFQTMRNAFFLGISMFFHGILMAIITFVPILLFFINLDLFLRTLPLFLGFGAALAAQINTFILKRIFKKIDPSSNSMLDTKFKRKEPINQ